MAQHLLSLENLHLVRGGLVAAMMRKALDRMLDDLENAPDIKTAREVVLHVRAKPIVENSELSDVEFEFEVRSKTPARVCTERMTPRSGARGGKGFAFAEETADEASD